MGEAKETTLTERQRYWLEQVEACEASGKTIAEYAMDHGIEAKTMYAGKKALVKKGVLPRTNPPRFQRAQLVAPVVASECQIQLPNGILVTVAGTVDADVLTIVLNTAAALS
jgi:hypothetical protein